MLRCKPFTVPFNRPALFRKRPASQRRTCGLSASGALGVAPSGFGEAISNPLRHAQTGFLGSLFVGFALRRCDAEFEPCAKNLIGRFRWSAFGICHTRHCTDKKYYCNPIDLRTSVRTILVVKENTPIIGKQAMDARQQRGLEIAAIFKVVQKGKVWIVPSQSGKGKYTVCPDKEQPHCSCPDHEAGFKCKHIFAVEYVIQREFVFNDLGDRVGESVTESVTISQTTKRKTYKQNWPAYNKAQVNEKDTFQVLLRDLCNGIIEHPIAGKRGRPRINLADAIFSAVFKVYSTVSGRRFMSDLRDAHGKGHINRLPSYGSLFNVLEAEGTFDVLKALVVESAKPLNVLECRFACDSSGFSGCRFDRWYDQKYGEIRSKRAWVKVHAMCGVLTNVVTAIEIHDQDANDSPQLKPLLRTTVEGFEVKELSADMAYSSHSNLNTIVGTGAMPLIPFKCNATPASGGVWAKMYHYFHLHREEFEARYHLRSNVESTFSMIKAKFGDSVRSKTDTAMRNESLAKVLCHNICCLIQSIHEFDIEATFWAEPMKLAARELPPTRPSWVSGKAPKKIGASNANGLLDRHCDCPEMERN